MTTSFVYGPEGVVAGIAASTSTQTYKLQSQISGLKKDIAKLTQELAGLNAQISGLVRTYRVNGVWTSVAAYNDYLIATAKKTEKERQRAQKTKDLKAKEWALSVSTKPATTTRPAGGGSQTDVTTQKGGNVTGDLKYNVPAVKEAYFTSDLNLSDMEFANFTGTVSKSNRTVSNQPRKTVTDAKELWANGITSKGMFQTWTPPNGYAASNFIDGYDTSNILGKTTFQKYGFQFLYNPGTIAMTYSGNVDVDIALLLSGREKFNPVSTKATQSTVSFEILLNRMLDMKYYNKTTGRLQAGQNASTLYGGRAPTAKEQEDIVNKGTMYDVEFLLKTLFGFEVPSQLRNEKTADMGFVIPRPVELHLGNKLRYLVYVEGFSLNHVIFDERMVPLFTTLNITANRVPDYGSEIATDGGR